jgi:hypothetical protein
MERHRVGEGPVTVEDVAVVFGRVEGIIVERVLFIGPIFQFRGR